MYSQANTDKLESLIQEAIRMDNRQIERVKEKAPFRGNSSIGRNTNFNAFSPTPTPFIPPRDPNAMDVDATTTGRSAEDYRRFMAGKCYGCGSRSHLKADGHHKRDVCNYCGLTGHLANVCRRKFMGMLGRVNARTASATSIITEPSTSTIAATTSTPTTPDLAQVLQQLASNQQALVAQISELRQNF